MLEEAREQLAKAIQSPATYEPLLAQLILQALFRFTDQNGEHPVALQIRQQDLAITKKALSSALSAYEEATGHRPAQVTIDEREWLQSELGGVTASTLNGRIVLQNTMEARLDLAIEAMLPAIRTELFGPSQTRRFFD